MEIKSVNITTATTTTTITATTNIIIIITTTTTTTTINVYLIKRPYCSKSHSTGTDPK